MIWYDIRAEWTAITQPTKVPTPDGMCKNNLSRVETPPNLHIANYDTINKSKFITHYIDI